MNDLIDNEFEFNNSTLYLLFTKVNHDGFIDFRHYYTSIKYEENKILYEFDDLNVVLIRDNLVNFEKNYILFYRREDQLI